MIVDRDGLIALRGAVAMVDGCFDPLHKGHIDYFRAARTLGVPVLCNLAADAYVRTKHPVLLPEEYRASVIDALRDIDYTHINRTSTADVLSVLRPRFYVKGRDWEGRLPEEQVRLCKDLGIEIVLLDTERDSSMRLLSKFAGGDAPDERRRRVADFESLVASQRHTPSSHYDEEYFTSAWRAGGNNYQLETRRQIEGRNPQLIKDVFEPKRVLDMGCGPGALMYLLHELGVSCDGVDFSARSRELAPPEMRDRITIGSVTDVAIPSDSYDLIVCREVFEHLTVLEVRRAVANLCRITSRFIYLTTRFHPEPADLLAVTDQPEVDPTHITLLHKEFLRVLFVLEGVRSRRDLEARMDWLAKGRVLVFEKPAPVTA
jgi:cytidyltransferase-like protein